MILLKTQNKTKQNKTKQNKTKQNKTKTKQRVFFSSTKDRSVDLKINCVVEIRG